MVTDSPQLTRDTRGAEERIAEAERALDRSPSIADELLGSVVSDFAHSDPGAAGRAAYLMARLAVMAARPRAALGKIEQARTLFERAGMPTAKARTDLGRINVLNDLGLHRQAVQVGEELMRHLRQADDPTEEVRWMLAGAAENTGASNGWLGRHAEALALYEQARVAYAEIGDEVDEARVAANRGVELMELGRHTEALQLLQEAETIFVDEGDDLSASRCLAYVAKVHAKAGRYGASIDALDRADVRLGPLEQSNDHLRVSLVWAEVYAVLNLTDEALNRCNALIPRFEEAGMTRDAGLAELVKADVLVTAQAARSASPAAAQAAIAAARQRFTAAELPAMIALCELLESETVRTGEANVLAAKAYATLLEAGHASESVGAALRCAELTIELDAADSSGDGSRYIEQAAELIARHQLEALNWRLHHLRGLYAEQNGQTEAAAAHYGLALNALKNLRSGIGADALRIPFMGGRRRVQEELVSVLLRLGQVDDAAAVTESERAETLVGRLAARSVPTVTAGTSKERRVDERPNGPQLVPSSADATMTYQTLGDEIICFIRRAEDRTPQLVRTGATVSKTESLLQRLDAQWRRMEDPRLSNHQDTLRRSTERLLQDLYLGLFEPAEEHLSPEDSIMVAPVGPLSNVPFAALHDGLAHLIERFEISITPSISVASHQVSKATSGRTVVVGVADEAAPQILSEAERVAELTDATLLVNENATVEAVRAKAEGAEVLHLAAHGIFRPDNPWFSAVRLADGWLRALDIERWDLTGSLVVFAACRSGQQSAMGGGDELLGIPRACLAAGASAVVVNLWPADDEQSVGLMTGLHQHLKSKAPASALRASQRSAMSEAPHPYHWAPAVLYGARQSGHVSDNNREVIR